MTKRFFQSPTNILIIIGLIILAFLLIWMVSPGLFRSPVLEEGGIEEWIREANEDEVLQVSKKIDEELKEFEVGYWGFDEDNVNDSSKYGNNGKAYEISFESGILGRAARFKDKDSYIEIPNNDNLNFGTGDFTYSLWFKADEVSPNPAYQLLCKRGEGSGGYELQISSRALNAYFGGSKTKETLVSPFISENTWYFVVVVKRDNEGYLYINGNLESNTTVDCDVDNISPLYLGRDFNLDLDEYFKGLIDEVHIYNQGLTISQVREHYLAGLAGHF